ncbi:M23 family metallopeptidase [Sandaracinus amylolyticus]|uniref:M23 family metallopeptidase n=1 Tax=Sandaracinus amylolyticus TaxID=927083 RepID=UPI001F485C9C|nr:M23 family metallopeptidase [Sandaracinus amylolyticus]UJR81258.1 Glycyl-glycine endopeptidase ALE-1 [Sandaracinus amylolyticus]
MRKRLGRALAALVLGAWLLALGAYFLDPVPLGSPVRGARAFHSTFGAPRSGGRRHQGVDVFAARGTSVLAAHDGIVVHVGTFSLGGRVVHTLGRRGVLCYYAHLDAWAPGLAVGRVGREGDVLGTVGNTGNARTTPPHLHFEARPLALGLAAVDPVTLLPARRFTASRR